MKSTLARMNPAVLTLAALVVFYIISFATGALVRHLLPEMFWLPQVAVKVLMVVVAIAVARAAQLDLRDLGFRRATAPIYARALGIGLVLGIVATSAVLLSGATGLRPMMKNYSFGQIVLFVWGISSVSEEIFCRGTFQTLLFGSEHTAAKLGALLPSALLFGLMHVGLIIVGVDFPSIAILIPLLTCLGLLTAWARARSGSLYPAIVGHVAFNVGGVGGGIIYTLMAGHPPA